MENPPAILKLLLIRFVRHVKLAGVNKGVSVNIEGRMICSCLS